MPLYEYACKKCGHQFEARQRISEAPLTKCPACNEEALEKLVSASSFALKGGGWYADGYGSGSSGASTSGSTSSKPSKVSGETKPAESKPAESKPAADSTPAASPAPKKSGD
jgi:putative FmdB family regulatory protein